MREKNNDGGFMNDNKKLWKKVKKMDLGNPIITTLVGIVVFYPAGLPAHFVEILRFWRILWSFERRTVTENQEGIE